MCCNIPITKMKPLVLFLLSQEPYNVVEKKYLSGNDKTMGYCSGYVFANKIGRSKQMPFYAGKCYQQNR